MERTTLAFALLIVQLVVGGCASTNNPPEVQLSDNEKLIAEFTSVNLPASESEDGVIVYIPSLFFGFSSANITGGVLDKLLFVARVSNEDYAKYRRIIIEGHTDSVGRAQYNNILSKNRAISVRNFLTSNDVDPNRIVITWYGESRPRAPNHFPDGTDNPDGRTINRRVELHYLNPE